MSKSLLLSAFALLAMTTPTMADDVTQSDAPFKITSCTVASTVVNSVLARGVSRTNGVTIVLANTSSKTASDVTVTGSYNGSTVTDTLKGPFEPNSSSMITKAYSPTLYVGPNASCHVTHVTFSDGTTWTMAPLASGN